MQKQLGFESRVLPEMRLSTAFGARNRFLGEPLKGDFNPIGNSSVSQRTGLAKKSPNVSSYVHALGSLGATNHMVRRTTYLLNSATIRGFGSWHLQIQGQHGAKTSFPRYKSSQHVYFEYGRNRHQVGCAAFSPFAEAGGEDIDEKYIDSEENKEFQTGTGRIRVDKSKVRNQGLQEMAEAFNISPQIAFGIAGGIAFAALILPFFMKSLGHGLPLKTMGLSYLTMLCGFYMAWNIGANDVANAMGTSVGSGALTLRQAVLTAAVLEFLGALLMGSHVSSTMQKGLLVVSVFNGKDSLLFAGMLSSLAAAGTWLQVASYYGWPVSTTHCIVGAMVGFGMVYGGVGAVFWRSLARVVSSWVVSPVMGAAVSFLVYKCIRTFVYSAPNPGQAAAAAAPVAVFLGVTGISYIAFPLSKIPLTAATQALGCGILGAIIITDVIHRQLGNLLASSKKKQLNERHSPRRIGFLSEIAGPTGSQLKIVYSVFGYMQVLSACFMSFAHGANDVANAIGPIAAALSILQAKDLGGDIIVPIDVLAWGGFGIVAGLMVWGYTVIATIGKKITELTPTRGFAAEFAAAMVVVVASKLGLPISATHTLVGAVMGVGFARGLNSVQIETIQEIVASWVVTIPVGAVLSIIYTWILTKMIRSLV